MLMTIVGMRAEAADSPAGMRTGTASANRNGAMAPRVHTAVRVAPHWGNMPHRNGSKRRLHTAMMAMSTNA